MKHSYQPGNKLGNEILFWMGILAILIFLLTFSITLTIINIPLFMISLWFSKAYELVGLTFSTVMDNYNILMAYLNFPWVEALNMPDFPTSVNAAIHFMEVKNLFYLNYGAMVLSALIAAFSLWKLNASRNLWRLYWPFKQLRWLPMIIIVILIFNFNTIFVGFHELVFQNDYWLFNPATDPIILVLDESFFLLCFISVFVIIQLGIELVYRLGKKDFQERIIGDYTKKPRKRV
jgi:integral membrane protein (TIGR01906 family)